MEPVACPEHPGQTAFVACRTCKRPACTYCLDGGPADICEACSSLDEQHGSIALERSDLGWHLRIARTFRQVLAESGVTLAALGPGHVGPAIAWGALCWSAASALSLLCLSPFIALTSVGYGASLPIGDVRPSAFAFVCCGGPHLQSFVGVVATIGSALVFHLAALVVGGTGSFSAAIRSTGYAQAVVLVWAPLTICMIIPQLGFIVLSLGFLAQLLWGASVLVTVAQSQYGLTGGRAIFAGTVPAGLLVLSLAAVLGLVWLAGEARSPDLSPDRYEETPVGNPYYGE
jgi:hypothetical protein